MIRKTIGSILVGTASLLLFLSPGWYLMFCFGAYILFAVSFVKGLMITMAAVIGGFVIQYLSGLLLLAGSFFGRNQD